MKKIFFSVLAIAALAACTKSEVQYDAPQEIGFAPAVKNITKAAMTAGTLLELNPDQQLGIWAFWNYNGSELLGSHTVEYLDNATFGKKDATLANGTEVTAWGGVGYAYPWPNNGTLRFAGYTKFTSDGTVSYSGVAGDTITFTDYTQANGFDLCWFKTTDPFNNRTTGTAIEVTLSHALTWLTFKVKGEGAAVGWKVNSIVLNNIASVGTGVCCGEGTGVAKWTCAPTAYTTNMPLLSTELPLTDSFVNIEGTTPKNDFVVIPQAIKDRGQEGAKTSATLTIYYSFPVGDPEVAENWKTDNKVVNLDLTANFDGNENEWKSGVHYTYNLTFTANEILVAPKYDGWHPIDQPVTVD